MKNDVVEDIDGGGNQSNIERPCAEQDILQEVTIIEEPKICDFLYLSKLTSYSEKGSSQLAYLVKNWEYKQANAVRHLKEELNNLNKQKHEAELKQLEIVEEHWFVEEDFEVDKRPISIVDEVYNVVAENKSLDIEAEYDTVMYWKQKARRLEKMLEASIQREEILMEKLKGSIKSLEKQSLPVEELSKISEKADSFLNFILQTAPFIIGHQDKDLRYRFIYNQFPSLNEEEILGKTDMEIFDGVEEYEAFKREVLQRGIPAKREITFQTKLFGSKTFLVYVEPVFSKAGDTIGINYIGMDVIDQVRKREKMANLSEEIAIQ